ncbi:MAG: hypothetical protein ACXWUG_10315 [Polyangiales bacterium]
MEKLLSVLFVVALVGCAESDNSPVKPKDGGKSDAISLGDGGTLPDTGGGGDDTSIPGDDTGGGTCVKASAAGSECGLFPQCGCSGSDNCDVHTTDGKTQCGPSGSAGFNEPCTDFGQCQKGSSCIGGLCRPFCGSDSDCSGGKCKTATYTPSGSTTPVDVPGLDTCFTSCNPISPSGACGSQGCALLDDGTSACVGAGSATTKGACGSDPNACAPGYVCVSTGDCYKWCRVGGSASDCSGTSGTCTGFSTPAMYMGVEYGVCAY